MKQFFSKFYRELNSAKRGRRVETIFVDSSAVFIRESATANIILSPKFYWVRHETLPVKYLFQAKEYAPSLFEGVVQDGNYSYKVIKSADKFTLFAYDAKAILEELERLGVKSSQIENVYFAQTEFSECPLPIKIDSKSAILNQNGKLIKVPLSIAKEHTSVDKVLSFHTLSQHRIKLGKFNRFYEKKGALGIVYILLFLILLALIDIYYTSSLRGKFEVQEKEVLALYSLPSTSLQLNALAKEYENINRVQKSFRDAFSHILQTSFNQGERFESIKIDELKVSLIIRADRSREEYFKSYYGNFFKDVSLRNDGKNIIIEMRYE
ncbi:MAG: hypothetical protein LBQ18_05315 [Campylobacteraceae bacterium]|nr:hypothetical protein [Campylobacteraceae bacterium]